MDIHVSNKQRNLSIKKKQIAPIIAAVLSLEKVSCNELGVHFVEKEEICRLHQNFFDDPTPTDCISLPIDPPKGANEDSYCVLGDLFICPEVALEYANRHQCDPYQELTLYLVHGLLHLIGYDDMDEKNREVMRQAEGRHLKNLACLKLLLTSQKSN